MAQRSGGGVPPSADTRVGTSLASYRVVAPLGQGGMSVVYEAEDTRLHRHVALKILSSQLASDPRFRDQFLRESELAASIDHPNIIPIYEAGESDGCLFIAMRYVEGTDLRALLLREGRLEPRRSVEIAAQVGDALDAAHARGLVHRDVKPSNVLVDVRGHCYLSDFGLTTSAFDRGNLTAQHEVVGTVDYVAPEQLRSEPIDGRTDVYSLGCLMYECLTGEVPFPHESDVAVIYAQLEQPPPSARGINPRLPPAVDAPLKCALAKDPDERYPSCRALVDATTRALDLAALAAPARQRAPAGRTIALAGAIVAIGAAGAVWWLATRPAGVAIPTGADVVARIAPSNDAVGKLTRVGKGATAVSVSGQAAWVANSGDGSVTRVDTATDVTRRIAVKGTPVGIAARGAIVDVVSGPPNDSIITIDATTGRPGEPTSVGAGSDSEYAPLIVAGAGGLWLADAEQQTLSSADVGGTFVGFGKTFHIASDPTSLLTQYVSFDGLAAGEGVLWVAGDAYGRSVWRIAPSTGMTTRIPLPFTPAGIAAGEGAVWVTSLLDDTVARIDPVSDRITDTIRVGRGASAIAVGLGAVWVVDSLAGAVSRIDPSSHAVETFHVGLSPTAITTGAGAIWVTGTKQ